MNNFCKAWITSTLAPESITNVKSNENGSLDVITDEHRTKSVYVLSNNECVIALGESFSDLKEPVNMSFTEACVECAKLLELLTISI